MHLQMGMQSSSHPLQTPGTPLILATLETPTVRTVSTFQSPSDPLPLARKLVQTLQSSSDLASANNP